MQKRHCDNIIEMTVCKEQYISTGSKPERCVSLTPRRVACNGHDTIE